jgi:hypothetical protein
MFRIGTIRTPPSGGRKTTCIVSLLGLLVLGTSGCVGSGSSQQPDWMRPGVRVGSGRLEKTLFLNLSGMGSVTDIQLDKLHSPGKIELGVTGNYGAKFFDEHGKPVASVDFQVQEPDGPRVSSEIVRQFHSTGPLFFRHAFSFDSLADSNGKEIWRTSYVSNARTFGYVGQDGAPEFFFAKQDDSVEALNVSGATLWQTRKVGWADNCELVGSKDTGRSVLAEVGGKLVTLSLDGTIVSKAGPAIEVEDVFSDFSVVHWPAVCQADCLLVSGNDRFFLLTSDAQRIVAALGPAIFAMNARGLAVRLHQNEPPLLAVAGLLPYQGQWVGFSAVHGELFVFDAHGKLVYYEVLPEPVEALGILPADDGKTETLLVGGTEKVWRYSAPQAQTSR